jgi:hypothetical protein
MAAGITSMGQSDEDKDACFSEYGKYSVSIKIWISSKALFVLSHELGHVSYQVPNFEAYIDYYRKQYSSLIRDSNCIGHSTSDKSGRNASIFEKEFKKDFLVSLRFRNDDAPLETPLVLMEEIRRKIKVAWY